MKIRREFKGFLCGVSGSALAFALVFLSSAPAATAKEDDQVPSWEAAGCAFETGTYVAEIPWVPTDESEAGSDQCAVRPRPFTDLLQSSASEKLDATGNQSSPVSTLIRLAPKRGPPASLLFV